MPEVVDTFETHAPESKRSRTPPNNTELDGDGPGHGAASKLGGRARRREISITRAIKQACADLQASCLNVLGTKQARGLVLHFCRVRTGHRCRAGAGKVSYCVEHRLARFSIGWPFSIDLSRWPPHTQGPPLRCTIRASTASARWTGERGCASQHAVGNPAGSGLFDRKTACKGLASSIRDVGDSRRLGQRRYPVCTGTRTCCPSTPP